MKAKEFVSLLWPLHVAGKDPDPEVAKAANLEFDRHLFVLKQSCLEPLKKKLEHLASEASRKDGSNRWENEYSQMMMTAGVKWNAVAHGLAEKTEDRKELFPYLHGGILVPDLMNLWVECQDREETPLVVVGTFDFLRRLAQRSGLSSTENGDRLFKKTYIMIGEWILDSITENLTSEKPDRSRYIEDMQAAGQLGHVAMAKAQELSANLMVASGINVGEFLSGGPSK